MATSDFYIEDNSNIENKKLEAAKGLYLSGNYQGALKLYLDMINMSVSYKLYYEIGRCYYKMLDFINAELYFKRSIELENYKNPSYVFLGNIYFRQENVQKALEYWMTSFSYRPDDEAVCLNLATSYFTKGMKFQSMLYYMKYLKYAKNKQSSHYLDIRKTVDEFIKIGNDFYQKALRAVSMKDNATAIQALEYGLRNYPINFDANYLLGKIFYEEKKYMQALIYLKQAYCIDNRSLDVLEKLSTVYAKLGDFTSSYCALKRMLPLVISNQKEYLEIMQTARQLESSFDMYSADGHKEWGQKYFDDNNYHFALFEYENSVIIDNKLSFDLDKILEKLRMFINPEERIVKSCFERGGAAYSNGDYRQSNKYFTKIMTLSKEDSADYKFARSRIVNV